MRKARPEYELRGLVAREIGGHSVVLPIWLGIDREEVLAFSPPLPTRSPSRQVMWGRPKKLPFRYYWVGAPTSTQRPTELR